MAPQPIFSVSPVYDYVFHEMSALGNFMVYFVAIRISFANDINHARMSLVPLLYHNFFVWGFKLIRSVLYFL
jgi:hypothetical protein